MEGRRSKGKDLQAVEVVEKQGPYGVAWWVYKRDELLGLDDPPVALVGCQAQSLRFGIADRRRGRRGRWQTGYVQYVVVLVVAVAQRYCGEERSVSQVENDQSAIRWTKQDK